MSGPPTITSPSALGLRLAGMAHPPESLCVWGVVPKGPTVAIVGSRKPSTDGERSARRLGRELAERGVVVASGGALGVDAAAHEGALEAGGQTIVFAPAWLTRPYPAQHAALFERILDQGGGYVCLVGEERAARFSDFFARNEALAAHSGAVVVGQCGFKSGTKNTVKHSRALGRPLLVLPSLYFDAAGEGSNALAAEGLPLVRSAEQVALLVGGSPGRKGPEPAASEEASDPVTRALHGGARTLDEVLELTHLSPGEVRHQLLLLTLSGHLVEDERGLLRYQAPRS